MATRTAALRLGVLPLVLALAAVAVHRVTGRFWGDLRVYRAGAAEAAARDGGLYDLALHGVVGNNTDPSFTVAFTYPPFTALLLRPLAWIGVDAAVGLWTFGSALALETAIWITLAAAGRPRPSRTRLTPLLAVLALPMYPVLGHLQSGQIGLLLMAVLLLDLTADPGRRWHGLGVGLASAIKLTPLIFVVYLAATHRPRAAARALAVFSPPWPSASRGGRRTHGGTGAGSSWTARVSAATLAP